MIRNQIYQVTEKELFNLKQEFIQDDQLFYGEIDGKNIQNWEDYRNIISRVFHFPDKWVVNIAGYDDWMRDLSWLEKGKYVLVIYNYSDFLQSDLAMREIIMSGFSDLILPFWEEEVERVVVDGNAKSFQVYLVVEG